MRAKHGLYAYGIVGKCPAQLATLGIDKQNKVYSVANGNICVIVSKIDIANFQNQVQHLLSTLSKIVDQNATEELLQAHEDVVDTLMQDTTVVPFKFGTILKDEKAASQMLQEYEQKFNKLLAKFTGKAEWGLKVYSDKQAFTQYLVQSEPEFQNLTREKVSRGTAYLLGKKMEDELKTHAGARLAKVVEAIFQELEKNANESQLNRTLPQQLTGKKHEMILNAVFLVEKAKVAKFCQQGKKLTEKYKAMGLDLEVSGPWPPYSFTD